MLESEQTMEELAVPEISRRPARVISIDSRLSHRAPARGFEEPKPVTQGRLAQGLQLRLEEMRITQQLREFRLQLEADLAAGAEIENGDLRYDPELRIVRPNITNALVGG